MKAPVFGRASILSALSVVVLLASCGGSTPSSTSSSAVHLNVQVYGAGANISWLTQIAFYEGFFSKNGIDATLTTTTTGPLTLAALLSGSVDVAECDPTICLPPVEKGADLAAFVGQLGSLPILVARTGVSMPHINDSFPDNIRDLKGKKLAVPALGGIAFLMAKVLVADAGLTQNDVQFVATGSPVTTLAALQSKQVDAWTGYGAAVYQLIKSGQVQTILDLSHAGDKLAAYPDLAGLAASPQGAMWAKKSWLSANSTVVAHFRRAIAQADVWLHDPSNRQTFIDLFTSKLGATADMDPSLYVASTIDQAKGWFSAANAQSWMDFCVKNGIISSSIPVSQWLWPGTPPDEKAVQALAK